MYWFKKRIFNFAKHTQYIFCTSHSFWHNSDRNQYRNYIFMMQHLSVTEDSFAKNSSVHQHIYVSLSSLNAFRQDLLSCLQQLYCVNIDLLRTALHHCNIEFEILDSNCYNCRHITLMYWIRICAEELIWIQILSCFFVENHISVESATESAFLWPQFHDIYILL